MNQADDDAVVQLRKVVRLLVFLVTKDLTQRDQIARLSSVGFQPKEIAELIGTTPNTVSVTLSALRKQHGLRKQGPTQGARTNKERLDT